MYATTHYRDYEYVCPECKNRLAPINRHGEEMIGKKCYRFKKHKKGKAVRMTLVKLKSQKKFHFKGD